MTRELLTAFCALSLATAAAQVGIQAQQKPGGGLTIKVLEGDGALNDAQLRRGHDPVVQVLNTAGHPQEGATVTFLLPTTGAGGVFADTGSSLTTRTDVKGLAAGRGLRPNRSIGQFRIRVTAAWNGEAAAATLTQTNVGTTAKSGRSKKAAIAALIGGAAVGGILAAARGGKSTGAASAGSASLPVPPVSAGGGSGTTIVGGDPSLGPPH